MNSPHTSTLDRLRWRQRSAQLLLVGRMWMLMPVLSSLLAASATAEMPNTSTTHVLQAVTCGSESQCWAVGYSQLGNGPNQTLILRLRRNGKSWAVKSSPNTSPLESNQLNGVACASESQCWAVGTYSTNVSNTLIEQWNGRSWSIISSPNINGTLTAVTCSSASECWAVGSAGSSGNIQPVFERWDGNSWSVVAPIVAFYDSGLEGVTCNSETDCSAVGFTGQDAAVYHWDGSGWLPVADSGGSLTYSQLSTVSCGSPDSCQAVGFYSYFYNHQYFERTLIMQPFGSGWRRITSADTNDNNRLSGVACNSASNCWAVGYTATGGGQALIERWNGNAWSIAPSPTWTQPNGLASVACTSATNCWAAGFYELTSGSYQALIEHWNGTSWSVAELVPSPE